MRRRRPASAGSIPWFLPPRSMLHGVGRPRTRGLDAELLAIIRRCQSCASPRTSWSRGRRSPDGLTGQEPIQHIEADMPARGAPRDVAAIDVVPEREAGAAAERLQLPAEVVSPQLNSSASAVGPLGPGLRYLRRRPPPWRASPYRMPRLRSASNGAHSRSCSDPSAPARPCPADGELADQNERPSPRPSGHRRQGRGPVRTFTPSSFLSFLHDGLPHPIEMALQGVEVRRPDTAERRSQASTSLNAGLEAINPPLGFDARVDEARLAQHPQVLGHPGLRQGADAPRARRRNAPKKRGGSGWRGGSARQ